MSERQERAEVEGLVKQPAFLKFLWRSIQNADLLGHTRVTANGSAGRNLEYVEGRRSLGLDILRDAARAMPGDDPDATNLLLLTILREAAQPTPKEKPNGRRDRYDESEPDEEE